MWAPEAELKNLMLAGLNGDAAAHRSLLKYLSGYLRAYYRRQLGRIGRSATDAEDLVQEALLAIHTRRQCSLNGAYHCPLGCSMRTGRGPGRRYRCNRKMHSRRHWHRRPR